jgi:two-component system sensor histidine kinase KdpD
MSANSHSELQAVAAVPGPQRRGKLGRLHVFLGVGPGVGKTDAMRHAAAVQRAAGRDVLFAFAEAGEAEAIPHLDPPEGGLGIELAAIFNRRPEIVVVDNLAINDPSGTSGSRRHHDVLALLEAGMDVFCTLNIYEIASRAEILYPLTGITAQQAVPDGLLENAEITLVDLPPTALRQRLEKGQLRLPPAFKKSGIFETARLLELREMAIRFLAERAARDAQQARQVAGARGPANSGHRLLVAIELGWDAEKLIFLTRRLAGSMNAPWIVLCVETEPLSDGPGSRSLRTLELARELGAEVITTADDDFVDAVLRVALSRNITQIITGKPKLPSWRRPFAPEPAFARLARRSGDIAVHVAPLVKQDRPPPEARFGLAGTGRWQWLAAVGAAVAVTVGGFLLRPVLGPNASSLVSILAIVGVSAFLERGPALLATGLITLAWDYFFLPPYFHFAVARSEDVVLLTMYFVVALILGQFTTRIRTEEAAERQREARATALYLLTRELAEATTTAGIVEKLIDEMQSCFDSTVAVLLLDAANQLQLQAESTLNPGEKELAAAAWVIERRQAAGRFTGNLAMVDTMFLPLESSRRIVGVVGVRLHRAAPLNIHEKSLLEALARQAALALDRQQLSEVSEKAKLLAESERLGKTLLDSMSHEIRTPLAAIKAAAGDLAEVGGVSPAGRDSLAEINEAAERLDRLVGKVLDITRLESGHIKPLINECEVADIINVSVAETEKQMIHHSLTVNIAPGLPLIRTDFVFLQQALMNLLANAAAHTPPGSAVELRVWQREESLFISVTDRGPGIDPRHLSRIFDKFYRGPAAPTGGVGLGLSLVKGFVKSVGGSVSAANREGGGAEFVITLPLAGSSRRPPVAI